MVNEDFVKGKWSEIKGEVQKAWGKLTDSELDQAEGDYKAISGLIQQKYGDDKEKIQSKFSEIVTSFQKGKDSAIAAVKDTLKG